MMPPTKTIGPDAPATADDDVDQPSAKTKIPPPERRKKWWQYSTKTLRFLILAFKKAQDDDLIRHSSALAFTTILSLIPLLAVVSYFGARTFFAVDTLGDAPAIDQQRRLILLFSQILPYSEEAILSQLSTFLEHASTIGSFGFAAFVITTLSAFTTIEGTVNRIWKVSGKRSFRRRLLSFTLVLFWGPLLIGAAYSGMFYLRQQELFDRLDFAVLITLLPSFFTVLGLTMLYWLVPATRVQFRSALLGGLVATLLLELLRQGFGLYAARVPSLSLIYGSFGLVLLFMISVHLAWWIVLLGNEVAYAAQHYKRLIEHRFPAAAFESSWLGLAALVVLADRFRKGQPITPRELLAERLRIDADELLHIVTPLLDRGLIHETGGEDEGYLLGRDPQELQVTQVFATYEQLQDDFLGALSPACGPQVEKLYAKVIGKRRQQLGKMTLSQLIRTLRSG